MGDNDRVLSKPILVCNDLLDASLLRVPFDAFIQLAKKLDTLFCTVLPHTVPSLEEEIVAGICARDKLTVNKCEVADPGEDKILQDGRGSGAGAENQNPRGFEGQLT